MRKYQINLRISLSLFIISCNLSMNRQLKQQAQQDGSSSQRFYEQASLPTRIHHSQYMPVAGGAQPFWERAHALGAPALGVGSGFIASGPLPLDQANQLRSSAEYQKHLIAAQSLEHNFNPTSSQHEMSRSQNTMASLNVSPNQTPNPPQPRSYIQQSAPRATAHGSASEAPLGSHRGHPYLPDGSLPAIFNSQDSSEFSLLKASTEEQLQMHQNSWLGSLDPRGKELLQTESPGTKHNIPRYMTQSQMKVMQNQAPNLKSNQSQTPIVAGPMLAKKKNASALKSNAAPRGAVTARVAHREDYQSVGRVQKAKRGDQTERSAKNVSAPRKRDNSDLQGGRVASTSKRGSKSRNRKQPRSGSNRGKKKQMAAAREIHRNTFEGDLRQQDQELRNDSDVIEDTYEVLNAESMEENYNSPNFQMIHSNEETDRQEAQASLAKKANILIDVQNQHSPKRNQQIGKLVSDKQQVDENVRLSNTLTDANADNYLISQSLHTMSIQEKRVNGPRPNQSLINTISIQESAKQKQKNLEKQIDKLNQIESKHSLHSKGSAAAAGTPSNGHHNQSLHNPSSPMKDIMPLEKKSKNQLSIAAALANVSSNNKIDQVQLADPAASNAYQKLESQTLRDMLMKNNLSSRDQKEFQKEFDEFQEELRKRSSESRTQEQIENQLSKSHNYMSDIGEGAGRGGRYLLGMRFTPGLSNGSDSQTMRASLGLSNNFKKKSENASAHQLNQMSQQKRQLPPNQSFQSQQIFTDAMRLGSAINQMLNVHKKKNINYKQRFFDIWKLQTLLATQTGKTQNRQEVNSSMASIYKNKLLQRDQSRSSSASGLIHIIHQTRPMHLVADGDAASSGDYDENASKDLEDVPEYREMRKKQENELKLRKAILAVFRFKARSTAQKFHHWKYQIQFEKRFQLEVKMVTEMLERKYAQQRRVGAQVQPDSSPETLDSFAITGAAAAQQEKHAENLSDNADEDVEDDEEEVQLNRQPDDASSRQKNQQMSRLDDKSKSVSVVESKKPFHAPKATHRVINQMHAKLPFSGGESKQNLKEAHKVRAEQERAELMQTHLISEEREDVVDKRIALGLVPSKTNKSKQLTEEQEQMFKQILQSSQKNFANLLNQDEKSFTGSMSMLPELNAADNRQTSGQKSKHQYITFNRPTITSQHEQIRPSTASANERESIMRQGVFNQPLLDYQDELVQELRLKLNLRKASDLLITLLVKSRDRQFLMNFVKSGLVVVRRSNPRNDLQWVRQGILQLVSTGAFKNLISRSSSTTHCQHFEYRGLQRLQVLEVLRPVMLSGHSTLEQLGQSRQDLHPLKAVFHLWQLKAVLQIKGLKKTLIPLLRQMRAQHEGSEQQRMPSSIVSTSSSSLQKQKGRNIDCLQCFVELHDLQQDSLRAIGVVQGIIRRSQVKVFAKYFHRWGLMIASSKQEAKMVHRQARFGTDLQAELHQKMILKLNNQKSQCDAGIAQHYQMQRRTRSILQKFEQYQEMKKSHQEAAQDGQAFEAEYRTAGLKSGLSLADFEHLVKIYPDHTKDAAQELPPELLEKMKLYQNQMQLAEAENKKTQVETHVRQMCYDMLVKVLEVQGQEMERQDFRKTLEQEMEVGPQVDPRRDLEAENQRWIESGGRPSRKYQGQGSNQPRQMHKY